MKKRFTYFLRLLVLLALSCDISGVYAAVISSNTTKSSNYTYNESVTINSNRTLTVSTSNSSPNTTLTINGDLTINGTLTLNNNTSIIVTGNVTINGKLTLNDFSSFIVKKEEGKNNGNVIYNGSFTTQKEGVKIIIQGDFTVKDGKTFELGKTSGTGVQPSDLIVEGNVKLEGNGTIDTHLTRIVFKRSVTGSGKIRISKSTTIALLCLGNSEISTGNNGINFDVNKKDDEDIPDDVYSATPIYVGSGKNGVPNSGNSTSSEAYTNAIALLNANSEFLPIELTSFTTTVTESGYTFNWVTASEKENDYFTLEYSINGVDFSEIDYVHGTGTTSETSEYEYVWDDAPNFEMIYFRLKQTDYNGEYTYSDVIVSCRKKSAGATRTFRYGPLNLQVVDGELRYIENK